MKAETLKIGYTTWYLNGGKHRSKEITPNETQRDKGTLTMKALRQRNKGEKYNTCLTKISVENRDNREAIFKIPNKVLHVQMQT